MHPIRTLLAPLLLLAGVTCASSAPGTPASAAAVAATDRPVYLLVHGRGHAMRDSAEVRRSAQAAMVAGATARGFPAREMLRDGDVRLVWYADVAADRMAADVAAACAPTYDTVERPASEFAVVASLVGVLLDIAGDAPELRDLRADARYIADRRVQCAAEQRLHAEVARAAREGRPVVIVAHSMGALVTWGYLQRRHARHGNDVPEVARLVTVGSPLGSPEIRSMVFGEWVEELSIPRAVRAWVNVVDSRDPFAAPVAAGQATAASSAARAVDTWVTGERADPHLLEGYLRDPAGVKAVIGAWCDTVRPLPRDVAVGCSQTND